MVDILLSAYNGEAFLREQLDSILNQTYKDFRLIIRDDGSADSTADIITEYVRKEPSRVVFINNIGGGEQGGHLGFNLSYNELLEYSLKYPAADYIMFSDQDDVWLPEKVEISLKKIKELEEKFPDKPALVHSDLTVVNKDLKIINYSFFRHIGINPHNNSLNRLIMQNTVTGCAALINKKLAVLAKPVTGGVYFYDYWLALAAKLFGVIGVIDKPLILYRQHGSNVIGANAGGLRKFAGKFGIAADLYRQGRLLYDRYYDYGGNEGGGNGRGGIKSEDKIILRNFMKLGSANPAKRLYVIFKYKFLRQGFLRNAGFMPYMLFFIDPNPRI